MIGVWKKRESKPSTQHPHRTTRIGRRGNLLRRSRIWQREVAGTPGKKEIRRDNKRRRRDDQAAAQEPVEEPVEEPVDDEKDVNEEERSFTGTNIKTGEKKKWVDDEEVDEVEEDSDVEKEKDVRDEWEKGGKKGSLKDAGRKDVVEDDVKMVGGSAGVTGGFEQRPDLSRYGRKR